MTKKYFGTDGIRGEVGKAPITPDFVLKLGWAAGKVLAKKGKREVLVGKDTRISGYMFESAIEAGFSAAGLNVTFLGPMPTPAVAYLTNAFNADAGVVISASHNSYIDNGIKFFNRDGTKLSDQTELEIEKWLEKPIECVPSSQLGKAKRLKDAAGRYIEFCKNTLPFNTNLSNLHIVLDTAHGATYHIAPSVFRELGAKVDTIGAEPNGLNINADVGSTNPQALQKEVVKLGADLGIAYDGDGDRVVMVDAKGELLDGDDLIYIIAKRHLQLGVLGGGVVGTKMTNLGLETIFKKTGIELKRVDVGDRFVMAELVKQGWSLGGEASGHIVCRQHQTTGDGIIASLQVIGAMVNSGKSLAELAQGFEKTPQVLINLKTKNAKALALNAQVIKEVTAVEKLLNEGDNSGRVLLRPSGTEPLLRVMLESNHPQIQELTEELVDFIAKLD